MAIKILDLDILSLPSEISGLNGYKSAFILFRFNGRPFGQMYMPIRENRVDGEELRQWLFNSFEQQICIYWLYDFLGLDIDLHESKESHKATIAVCTRDRADDLQQCLDALVRLEDDGQEVLVVDNAPSSDATLQLVRRYGKARYVREDRPGLNIARNRALREAQNEIIAFTDDDATPDRGWLRGLLRNFDDPLVLCATGLTMPKELETKAQQWHERLSSFGRGFTRRVFDCYNFNPMAAGHVGAGVNMALRKKTLDWVGPFDEALDAGTPTRTGGDNEMFSRILTGGYRIVYDPAALNWHRHRRTWQELRRMMAGNASGVYAAWTASLLRHREFQVFEPAWQWFRNCQWPALRQALSGNSNRRPFDLILAEWRGCTTGPWAYLYSLWKNRVSKSEQVHG